jgi:hypothetical protein
MDFTGIGFITEDDFLKSLVCTKAGFTLEEIKDYFYLSNMFQDGGMNFDNFKKTFFPHLY